MSQEGGVLPDAVRDVVVGLAAEALGALPPEEVPPALRAVARFTPAKRARLAAGGLAAALETDGAFRSSVATRARERDPDLAAAVAAGVALPAAPPEQVAAYAYLLRPPGWPGRVAAAADALARSAASAAAAATADELTRLTGQLAAARAAAAAHAAQLTAAADRARADADAARAEVVALRKRVRELGERAASAERLLAATREVPAAAPPDPAQVRRLRARVAELETALTAARTGARDATYGDRVRLRVLLDALVRASTGLQRELALPPVEHRPADLVDADPGTAPGPPVQGRDGDDPAVLDALLTAPLVHLLVDGYNVTKTGFGDQPLEVQRARLVAALGPLAARVAAEVTVVFDGQDGVAPVAPAGPRGVRVRFSRSGRTADDVLRAMVAAEPPGRALVVVTSDRAVADDVRAAGAWVVPSRALLRLLER